MCKSKNVPIATLFVYTIYLNKYYAEYVNTSQIYLAFKIRREERMVSYIFCGNILCNSLHSYAIL